MNVKMFIVFVLSVSVLLLPGCDLGGEEDSGSPPLPPPIEVDEGEFLALSHLDEKPVREAGEVTTLAQNFMQTMARSSGSNAVIVGAPEVVTALIEDGFVAAGSDAEPGASPSELPFYRYTTRDTAANKTGIMIASSDKRIGGVLAYIEDDADSPEADAFMGMLASSLAAYTLTRVDEYNSISEEDIETARQIATGTRPSAKSASLWSVSRNVEISHSGTPLPPLIETKWGQGDGYWRVLNLVKGAAEYTIGSAPVAMGQLMAYHEWPAKSSLDSKEIQHPFDADMGTINLSEIVYDWALMKAFPKATDSGMDNKGKLGINTLLYEAAVTTGTTHGRKRYSEATTTPIGNVIGAFAQMGYDVSRSGLRPYDYETIKTSIDQHQPVIVSAAALQHDHVTTTTWTTTEHCWLDIFHWFDKTTDHSKDSYSTTFSKECTWIIDDYEEREYQDPIRTSLGVNATLSHTAEFVHCNFGDNGSSNGWYVSKIFSPLYEGAVDDVQRSVSGSPVVLRSVTTKTTDIGGDGDYYQFNMQIIPYLMPKK
jgi:hypothetical protein